MTIEAPSSKVANGSAAAVVVAGVLELLRWRWGIEVPGIVGDAGIVLVGLLVAYVTRETRPSTSMIEAAGRVSGQGQG